MKDSINIGVVGTGKLGTYHIQKLLRQNYVNFIGVFDSNKEHANLKKDLKTKLTVLRVAVLLNKFGFTSFILSFL